MEKNIKRDGVDKAFNIKVEKQFLHPEYFINLEQQELIGDTGLLKILELKSSNSQKPNFIARWDKNKDTIDVDIYNTDIDAKKRFLTRKKGYEGHRPELVDTNNRTFKIFISILGEKIYKGTVFFNINISMHPSAGKLEVTRAAVNLKNTSNKSDRDT